MSSSLDKKVRFYEENRNESNLLVSSNTNNTEENSIMDHLSIFKDSNENHSTGNFGIL